MHYFLVALQFLTRIHIIKQGNLRAADFGRSTRYFPLVGLVLGILYMLASWCLIAIFGWSNVVTTTLVILPVLLTGALHCDGFMDTMDGLFSGRERDRMLEIMKDSRVGSFGVVAFVMLMMINWSLLRDTPLLLIMTTLFVMPIVGRMAMVLAISFFSYAREEGMGKAFSDHANGKTVLIAAISTVLFVIPWGPAAIYALFAGLSFAWFFSTYAARRLGGLTGDVYGAVEILTETVVLFVFFAAHWLPGGMLLLWKSW